MTGAMLGKHLKKANIYLLLIIGSFFSLLPLLWMLRSSLLSSAKIFQMPPIIVPDKPQWENYVRAMTILPFSRYFINSFMIVTAVVTGSVITSSFCAYGLSRIQWKGRTFVFSAIISSMMLPSAVTLIPQFLVWNKLGVTNNFIPLIAPAWFGGGAFYIFLLRQFYMAIPKDLDESAWMDGAGHLIIFSHIIFPITRPSVIVVGLFSFLNTWNDFLAPLVYLNDEAKYTLRLACSCSADSIRRNGIFLWPHHALYFCP
jgi:multiple sugar transport system permease protein